jgi:hypothetical protein
MTDHLELPPRAIVTEQELRSYPPDMRKQFLGDPADWLPGRITMHGQSEFHARMRLYGVAVALQYLVGTPWTRGTSSTRRLRVECLDPPLGMAWILPATDGELTLLGQQRLRLRFEGSVVAARRRSVRRLSATWVMRAVTAGITARLTAQAPPVPPSRAWHT